MPLCRLYIVLCWFVMTHSTVDFLTKLDIKICVCMNGDLQGEANYLASPYHALAGACQKPLKTYAMIRPCRRQMYHCLWMFLENFNPCSLEGRFLLRKQIKMHYLFNQLASPLHWKQLRNYLSGLCINNDYGGFLHFQPPNFGYISYAPFYTVTWHGDVDLRLFWKQVKATSTPCEAFHQYVAHLPCYGGDGITQSRRGSDRMGIPSLW